MNLWLMNVAYSNKKFGLVIYGTENWNYISVAHRAYHRRAGQICPDDLAFLTDRVDRQFQLGCLKLGLFFRDCHSSVSWSPSHAVQLKWRARAYALAPLYLYRSHLPSHHPGDPLRATAEDRVATRAVSVTICRLLRPAPIRRMSTGDDGQLFTFPRGWSCIIDHRRCGH